MSTDREFLILEKRVIALEAALEKALLALASKDEPCLSEDTKKKLFEIYNEF